MNQRSTRHALRDWRRRSLIGTFTATLVVLLSLVATPSAEAVPQPCPDGAICFYDAANGTGIKYGVWGSDGSVPWLYSFNDRTDSVINNTGWTWYWYVDKDFRGTRRAISPRRHVPQNLHPYINILSSAKKCWCL
jgi:hypothetical protein